MYVKFIWNAPNTREIGEIYDQIFSKIVSLSTDYSKVVHILKTFHQIKLYFGIICDFTLL